MLKGDMACLQPPVEYHIEGASPSLSSFGRRRSWGVQNLGLGLLTRQDSGQIKLSNPDLIRMVVLVEEWTELSDTSTQYATDKEQRIFQNAIECRSGGQLLAYAIRKRLKVNDEAILRNNLTLLKDAVKAVPGFFRDIATDKFFRRLWRIVVPDYKDPVSARLKKTLNLSNPQEIIKQYRSTNMVMILIRAWAEELEASSSFFTDPAAIFWMERFHSKSLKYHFPEVPVDEERPYIYGHELLRTCPTPTSIGQKSSELETDVIDLENILNRTDDISELADNNHAIHLLVQARLAYRKLIKVHANHKGTEYDKVESLNKKIQDVLDTFDNMRKNRKECLEKEKKASPIEETKRETERVPISPITRKDREEGSPHPSFTISAQQESETLKNLDDLLSLGLERNDED
eukprot:jgi/Galph1/5606/GphlegSOOS_G4227.1